MEREATKQQQHNNSRPLAGNMRCGMGWRKTGIIIMELAGEAYEINFRSATEVEYGTLGTKRVPRMEVWRRRGFVSWTDTTTGMCGWRLYTA
jgi:hypothetical protein